MEGESFQRLCSQPESTYQFARALSHNQTLEHLTIDYKAFFHGHEERYLAPTAKERQALICALRNQNFTLLTFLAANWDEIEDNRKTKQQIRYRYFLDLNGCGRRRLLDSSVASCPYNCIDLLAEHTENIDWLYYVLHRINPILLDGAGHT